MSAALLKIDVPGKLPLGTELLSTIQGIESIRALAAVHELDRSKLALEMDLFGSYASAHVGEKFLYSQIFGSPGEAIGLLFLCTPEVRNELAFAFRTRTETDADIDRHMAELEPTLEAMGVQYYRGICGDPKAQIRVISDFEIQEPLLLSQARN
jgi:hypothetical protein